MYILKYKPLTLLSTIEIIYFNFSCLRKYQIQNFKILLYNPRNQHKHNKMY